MPPSWHAVAACACTRTWPRPSTRSASVRSASACAPSTTSTTSAGSATTSGSRTACTSTTPRSHASAPPERVSRTARIRMRGSAPGSHRSPGSWSAGAPVGLGVDGAASNEDGGLASEMRAALQFARLAGGPQALTARQALARATIDGARCLGRDRRARLARGRQARRRGAVAPRRARRRGHRGSGRGARLRLRRRRSSCCSSVGGRSSREPSCARRTRRRWRSRSRGRAGSSPPGRRLGYDDRSHRPDEGAHPRSDPAARRHRHEDHSGGRHPEGQGRVRVLLGHPDGRDAVGCDLAQRPPARGHLVAGHLARAGDPGRARGPHPRGRPRPQAVRDGARRPAGARVAARSLPGRADRDRRRRRSGDGPARGRRDRGRVRRARAADRSRAGDGGGCTAAPPVRQRPAPRPDHPRRPRRGRRRGRHRRVRGRHAGPGVPRPRVGPRGPGRRGRRRSLHRHPVAARRPRPARPEPRPAAREGAPDD